MRMEFAPSEEVGRSRRGMRFVGILQALPQAVGSGDDGLRFIPYDEAFMDEIDKRRRARMHQRHHELPARKRVAGARDSLIFEFVGDLMQ